MITYIQGNMTNILVNSQEKSSNLFELRSFVYCEENHTLPDHLKTKRIGQNWKTVPASGNKVLENES